MAIFNKLFQKLHHNFTSIYLKEDLFMKILIVGGVAGGASCAARLRRLDENSEIVLFERGEHISFANCGLPYYIGNVITEKENLLVQTPAKMKERFQIDVRIFSEVTHIDTIKKVVTVHDTQQDISYEESYDKLVLSPGANPIRPYFKGIDGKNVFTLRNIPDTYAIKDFVDHNHPKTAVVVGGGYIGLEIAENLHHRNVEVTIVEMADQVLGPLDYEMATFIHAHLREKNVTLILKDGIQGFEHHKNYSEVQLSSGRKIQTDMIILGIGVRPETNLAKNAGLSLGEFGGIRVNEHLQTSDPHIYAVGDAIEVMDYTNSHYALIPLAGPANKQGRIVADNIMGKNEIYAGTQGTSVLKVFDMTVATTGNNEKLLKRFQIPYEKTYIHSGSHASYYPGSTPISIKLLFSPTDGKILGAQALGIEGVEKRIDVIATAVRAKMTVRDLETLELSYAPPYSSAKDPVNVIGFVASNILNGDQEVIHWDEIKNGDLKDSIFVDVRTPKEYQCGSIQDAINIPLDDIRNRLDEIPKNKRVILFCQVGLRGYLAYRILHQNGFIDVKNLSGGYKTYFSATEY
jgi:CoA-disulfide reductase